MDRTPVVNSRESRLPDRGKPHAGAWDFERYGAGPGVSMTQGIAYTMLKFDEPGARPEVFE